ncbi:MAG: TonB-dependent receptor [Bacteroidales bacterium]|nr:TonB-dependent receptor [Bacteroidales bacterium]
MKFLLFLFAFVIAYTNVVVAQTLVKGKFLDENTLEIIPYATFAIVKECDSLHYVSSGTTNENGQFSAIISQKGIFKVTLRYVGKATIIQSFEIHNNNIVDLGIIYTHDVDNMYGEVVVKAQKTRIINEPGKTKYNVDADPTQNSSSVLELLRKIPGVIVDGNDNITISGKKSFVIEINGRKNLAFTFNAVKSLKAMPATSIKSIEVITEPGAKYDAEGVGAIINLITEKKKKIDNTSSSFGFEIANKERQFNSSFCIQKNNFSAAVNGWLNYTNDEISWQNIKTYYDNKTVIQNINEFEVYSDDSHTTQYGFNVDMSYEFDTLNLLSVSMNTYVSNDNSYGDEIFRMTGSVFDREYIYNMFDDYNEKCISYSFGIDYQHIFKNNRDKILTLSYFGNSYKTDFHQALNSLSGYYNNAITICDQKSDDDNTTAEHTFQTDFVMPFNNNLTLDCGLKYIIRPCKSYNYHFTGENLNYLFDSTASLGFKHADNIYGTYLQFRFRNDNFGVNVGLRYEYSFRNVKYLFGKGENFTKDYNNLVPTISFIYSLTQKNSVGFSYNMRIGRPNVNMLNPYFSEYFSKVSYGNPNLKCEKYNDFKVYYTFNSDKINLKTAFLYKNTLQGIGQISFIQNNKTYSTFVNEICNNEYGSNLYFSVNIFDKLFYYINYQFLYKNLTYNLLNLQSKKPEAAVYTSFELYFTDDITFTFGWSGCTKRYGLQSESCSSSFGDFSLTYSLFEGRLDLSIKGITPFDDGANKHSVNMTQCSDFKDYVDFVYNCRSLSLSVNWRFNGNARVKKSKITIQNNDILNGKINRR